MKKSHNSVSVGVNRKQHRHFISGWIWPYIIIPACVAALLAIFFLVLGPILIHQIGIKYSLEFWLIALGVWAFVTVMCTLIWIYAGRHLIPKSYYTAVGQEMGQGKVDGCGTVYSYSENGRYNQVNSDQDQSMLCHSDQIVVYKHNKSKESSPSLQDSLDGLQKTNVEDENDQRSDSIEDEKEKPPSTQIIEAYPEKYIVRETTVIQINDHIKSSTKDNELVLPEQHTEQITDHSPRRVSYAGVISVNIPPSEEIKIENLDRNTLHAPRPPTPRFPRGMRVASNDSAVSAQLADLYPNHSSQKGAPSQVVEIPHQSLGSKDRVTSIEKVEVHQRKREQGSSSSSDSEESRQSLNGEIFTFENSPQSPTRDGIPVKSYTLETSVFKKVRLSEGRDKIDNDVRPKRMSLDRNQFLGWHPDEGVLEEADPGSKEREERRWKTSIGAWRPSTSTAHDYEIAEKPENAEEEDDDDVFHDVSDKAPESQIQVSHTVTVTKAEVHSTSV